MKTQKANQKPSCSLLSLLPSALPIAALFISITSISGYAQTPAVEDAKVEAAAKARNAKDMAEAKVDLEKASKTLEADLEKYGQFSKQSAAAYLAVSKAHTKAGNLDSSIEYALWSLKVEMKLRKEDDPELAQLYFYTGNRYYMYKQHPTAILYMKKAVEIYLNSNDNESLPLANTYEAIASIYINLEDFEKSLAYANQCLSIRQKKLKDDDEDLQRAKMNVDFLKKEIQKRAK